MDHAIEQLTEGLAHLRCADAPCTETTTQDQTPLVHELHRLLDRGGGEVLLALVAGADAKVHDTIVSVEVPWEMHDVCLEHLENAARALDACATRQYATPHRHSVVLIRAAPRAVEDHIEVRVAIVGNVDAGKSTMLGVLTKGALDDGRGKARVDLFRHKHELDTGRTSSVGTEVMGFRADGRAVVELRDEENVRKVPWEVVCREAAKVVSFIDLAGHERYLKTTVFGMTSGLPDYVVLMVGANAGLIGMSKEHLGIALALGIPVCVVVTKVDMCPAHVLEATMKQISKVLQSPGCRKTPVVMDSMQAVTDAAAQLPVERICPVFQVSNVTGANLGLLRAFLNLLPSSQARYAPLQHAPAEMPITDVFSVPFVGTVVSGVLTAGVVNVGDTLLLGPDSLGQFFPTAVRSIQRKRVNVECASAGQSISFALKRVRRNQVRKGMMLLARTSVPPVVHQEFEAEVLCLYHSTTLSLGSCIVLHAASIRQTVKIVAISKADARTTHYVDESKPVVRMGDRARVRLRFMAAAEYITPGTKLIAREGKTRLVGVVRGVSEGMILRPTLPHDRLGAGGAGPATFAVPPATRLSGTA